jgi:LAS superfamily LD-carboxypeptidase LdcB
LTRGYADAPGRRACVRSHGPRRARRRGRAHHHSAFRSDAEQAELWRRHPDSRWVAPPGTSLHRNGAELDLGPPAADGWLRANAERFHFTQRYSWE